MPETIDVRARLMIVEDNPDLLTILKELLSQEYEVAAVRRGEDAITLARTFKPDAIILDLQLPGIDGIETGLWIKREFAPVHIPILALTALAGPGDAETILGCGCCDAYLAKPAPLPEIRTHVESLLERTRAA